MPVFARGDHRVLFVHIPKNAGASIEQAFVDSGWQMDFHDRVFGPGSANALRRCTPQHLHAALLRQLFRVEAFDLVFHVVREPLGRFRSEYARAQHLRLRRHAVAAGTEPEPMATDAASVEQWAQRVLARYESNPYALDNHLRPQHEFVLRRAVTFRFESGVEEILAALDRDHGVELVPGQWRVHDRTVESGVSSSAVEISPRLEDRLRDFYAEDFRRFGY